MNTTETPADKALRKFMENHPRELARAKARNAKRRRIEQSGVIRRGLDKLVTGVAAGGLLTLLLVVAVAVLALIAWLVILSAGAILKLSGTVLVVVIASLAWQWVRGEKGSQG